jgi:6,7-dimethyl-8-ribityllumazine synthase
MSNNIAIVLGSFHKSQVEEMLSEARVTAKECGLNIIAERWAFVVGALAPKYTTL